MSKYEMTEIERRWIEDYCNQMISREEFALFKKALELSPDLRAATRQYLALDSNLRQGSESLADIEAAWSSSEPSKVVRFPSWIGIAVAAAIALLVGFGSDWFLYNSNNRIDEVATSSSEFEATANGYAVVHGIIDAKTESGSEIHAGDVLGSETISLVSGSVRVDFFSGAQVYIEAPAKLEIRSAWEATFHSGKLRAKVPPAARGFTIEANGRRIVDLGTEFGIDTSADEVKVEVFSGKIELEDRELLKGDAVSLTQDGRTTPIQSNIDSFSNLFAMTTGISESAKRSFANGVDYSDSFSRDPRLIAYYPFISEPAERSDWVPSRLYPENKELDGAVVLAEWVGGRWSGLKGAMEFRRPGSRVRVNIPGDFEAYTFSCWARIDSLDRRFNALFLADSYQTGEPHWQIRNDGVLMIGVMVDDQAPRPNPVAGQPLLGRSRNYYSPPFWDITKSGQWLHLVSIYDPKGRKAAHYVNGEKVSEKEVQEAYVIKRLRIGNAEIGNWGDPNRKDPSYAIRNLNGRIDELAIFNAALSESEIKTLYQKGQGN